MRTTTILRSSAVLAIGLIAAPAADAQDDWLELTTDRFTVVSELNERNTRRWAEEFGQFVEALHGLLPLDERLLPPLTAVLFERSGRFSRYRVRTESGLVAGNRAAFVNAGTWSVIGMPGRGSSGDLTTMYHEAVHWFMSADPTRYPLWFTEGIAEAFSTFEATRGGGEWGQPIRPHLEFLRALGLTPMEEFLQVTQDEALHTNASYYAQAWLFVHYLMFGREDGPALLSRFLNRLKETDVPEAFRSTFEIEFGEMDDLLRAYLNRGRFQLGTVELETLSADDLRSQPASPALVELSLARLALGTNNEDVAAEHLGALLEISPESAEAYDLLAEQSARAGDGRIGDYLDTAIALGSRDARTYERRAALMLGELAQGAGGDSGPAARFRQIADYAVRAIELRPVDMDRYRLFVRALLGVETITDADRRALELGRVIYPDQGIVVIGDAALALAEGDTKTALETLDTALSGDYRLSPEDERAGEALRNRLRRRLQ